MQVGDRVYVKDETPSLGGQYGYITAKSKVRDWDVTLDGHKGPLAFEEGSLLPVEVVVLEGKVWAPSVDGVNYALIGDFTVVGALMRMHGDDVRLTIERVKKEG